MPKRRPKRVNMIKARGKRPQREIAKMCEVAQQTYNHWELGRATPPAEKMVVLERVLGVPKEELFFDIFNSSDEDEGKNVAAVSA